MTTPEREEFEKLASVWKLDLSKYDDGSYCGGNTSLARLFWQARQPEIDALNDEVELISIARKSQNAAYEKKIDALKERIDRMQAAFSADPTQPEVELSAPFHEVIPIWMALKMVKVAMEDHNFPTPDDYYVNGVLRRVKKYAATDKLDAAHTPPEVEPIGYVNPRIISILNRRSSTDATIGSIKTTIYSEPLYASPLKK